MQDLGGLTTADISSMLELSESGAKAKTTENFCRIMGADSHFGGVRFNVLANRAEIHRNGKIEPWTDANEAEARTYIEHYYGLYSREKFADALRLLFKSREYNPVLSIVESIAWDGEERCEKFLHKWGKTEDTPYIREVSRLIFAGGIWRLYQPGCKFDDVPILIGTKQGEGKSSLIRFLAINDSFYGEVNQFDGQQAIEQLSGKWICEISELLALTRTKEVEASKAYITRAVDQYRKPYDRNVTELPRRCIFIGTTNNATPLRDIYNRRYYPVTMRTVGYDLYDHEQECRDYILQCWAEAREKYKQKQMPNFAKRDLVDTYREEQENARQDDWRIGAIEAYLDSKSCGDFVCIRELTQKALSLDGAGHDPSVLESKDIGMIMANFTDWERCGTHRFAQYGAQKSWKKTSGESNSDLPF